MKASQPHARSGKSDFVYSQWLSSAPPGEESGHFRHVRSPPGFQHNPRISRQPLQQNGHGNRRRPKMETRPPENTPEERQNPQRGPLRCRILRNAPPPSQRDGSHDEDLVGDGGGGDHGRRNESLRSGRFDNGSLRWYVLVGDGAHYPDAYYRTAEIWNDRVRFDGGTIGTELVRFRYLRSLNAHRVSYFLKLNGPASIIDSACSSSLNALDLAFRAIRSGRCDNAIVAGSNIILHPSNTLQFFQ
jgi:hypothetical protein